MDGVPDMTTLLYLEEDNVIHNLKVRFEKKSVYTNIGSILLSINPYVWIESLYGDKVMATYRKEPPSTNPHCYQIASRALNNLRATSENQSIIICGESGAGKTESAKCCISHLAKSRKSAASKNFVEQVISVNPLL
ncbi:hypothetical protein MHBO_002595, partial [Bonamia ostreae]